MPRSYSAACPTTPSFSPYLQQRPSPILKPGADLQNTRKEKRGSIFLSTIPTFFFHGALKHYNTLPLFLLSFGGRKKLAVRIGMAQREEEAEIRVTETLTLCVNNCGFYGNPATKNMCQGCFQAAQARPAASPRAVNAVSERSGEIRLGGIAEKEIRPRADEVAVAEGRVANRCSGCRRRVGLTGFRCRCGELFCGEHRYSDRHDCSFDYKAAGREAIGRENPVVRASKIVKI